MFRVRNLAILVALSVTPPALGAPPAPGVYTDEPPKAVKELIDLLKGGEEWVAKPLSERDDAAPYLRRELKVAAAISPRRERLVAAALTPIEDRIYKRNKKRYAVWAETGRFDLCAEFLVVCEKKDGFALADLTIPLRKRIGTSFSEAVDFTPPGWKGKKLKKELFWYPDFKAGRPAEHETGNDLTLPPTTAHSSPALIRADRCTVQVYDRAVWFVAVRSELQQNLLPSFGVAPNPDVDGKWDRSIVLVNSATQFTRAEESLIVCDGDVELLRGFSQSVLIANGNIWSKKWGGGRDCYFAATGDIKLPTQNQKNVSNSIFHAGGTVTLGGKPKQPDQVREKQTALPFEIRFLDPEEFGLTLAAQKDGVKVSELAKDSPFARYGVEAGDVVTSIDGAKTASLPDFRRQLRRGLLVESVVLKLRRGDQTLTRIVSLDGIPLPAAPMPREAKPSPAKAP